MTARTIFLNASEIESFEEREAYVRAQCKGDGRLMRQVEALLRANDDPDSILDRPAIDFEGLATLSHDRANSADATSIEAAGSTIGNYKLLQEIGQGGFGVVYMAEQEQPVRRQVALKIIKPGMDTREVIARFEAERQALALMDHPNIAKVFDAGATSSGRPYFVMELVKGVPITDFCDKNKFTTRKRLELFVAVCNAVQHAHQKGVIHRDLKPSNVMITLHDGKPVPKVIDFGISKAISQRLTEKTLFTRYGQMIGTPQYMSPEQAEMSGLDVDTRSDVYSLGVLLYELLTGTTPLQSDSLRDAGYAELLRMIQEDESPKPSLRLSTLGERLSVVCQQRGVHEGQMRQLIRGDLDWIAMKALEKDRGRRYETANGLAEDIQRHLDGNPVMACPPTFVYRFSKFARRYRSQVAVAAGIATLLMVSSVVAWYLFLAAQVARDDLKQANEQLLVKSNNALESEQQALHAKRELEQKLYDESIVRATALLQQGRLPDARKVLDAGQLSLRKWEWNHLRAAIPDANRLISGTAPIFDFHFDITGQKCAVTNQADQLQLFDAVTNKMIWERQVNVPQPMTPLIADDGKIFVYTNGIVRRSVSAALEIWRQDGTLLWRTADEDKVYSAPTISPDGKLWAFSRVADGLPVKGTIEIRDMTTNEIVAQQDIDFLGIAKFTRDSQHLVTVAAKSWDPAAGAMLQCRTLDGQVRWKLDIASIGQVTRLEGTDEIVIVEPHHGLTIVNTDSGAITQTIPGPSTGIGGDAEICVDGTRLLSRGIDGSVVIWDWENRRAIRAFELDDWRTTRTQLLPDGRHYASISNDGLSVEAFPVEPSAPILELSGATSHVIGLAYDGRTHELLSFDRHGVLRRWNPESGLELSCDRVTNYVEAMDFSIPENTLALGTRDGIQVVSLNRLETRANFPVSVKWWYSVKLSPKGKLVAACHDQGLILCDVKEQSTGLIAECEDAIRGISFLGEQQLAVLSDFGRLEILDLATMKRTEIKPAEIGRIARPILSLPKSHCIAIGLDENVEVWNIERREKVLTLNGTELVTQLAATADGTRLFVGDVNGHISVWNAITGRKLTALSGHERGAAMTPAVLGVQAMLWNESSSTLFTGDRVGGLRVWESAKPSNMLLARRNQVAAASKLVDRLAIYTDSPDDVQRRLQEDTNIPVEIAEIASRIVDARSREFSLFAKAEDKRSLTRRLSLASTWPSELGEAGVTRVRLANKMMNNIEVRLGIASLRSADASHMIDWTELVTSWAGDTSLQNEFDLYLATLQRNDAAYGSYATAVLQAVHHDWGLARDSLLKCQTGVERSSPFGLLLETQIAAIDLQLDDRRSYTTRCEWLLGMAESCDESRLLWRIARISSADEEFAARNEPLIREMIDRVQVDRVPRNEVSWYQITRSRMLLQQGGEDQTNLALQCSQDAYARIIDGPLANYARSTAAYLMREAGDQVGDAAASKDGKDVHDFILARQPFVRPDTSDVHRSWEQWICHKFFTHDE